MRREARRDLRRLRAVESAGEARGGLEHAHRGEAHGALVGGVGRRVDLGDIDAAHPEVGREQPRDAAQLVRLDAARDGSGAGWRDRAVADVDIEVDVDRAARGPRDPEGLGHDLAERAVVQLVAVDHGDTELLRAPTVLVGVGEVGDADLHDAPRVEARLDQAAHGRAVGAAVAQVVMGVERDEAGRAELVARDAERRRHRERVVAAERDDELRLPRELGDPCGRGALAVDGIGVGDVAHVDDAQRLVDDGLGLVAPRLRVARGDDMARVAAQGGAHGGGRHVRIRGREGGLRRRDADEREVDRVAAGGGPSAGAGPGRVVRQGALGRGVGAHACDASSGPRRGRERDPRRRLESRTRSGAVHPCGTRACGSIEVMNTRPAPVVVIGSSPLTVADVVSVARHDARIEVSEAGLARVAESRRVIEELANDTRPHYGVSTGFGALAKVQIPVEKRQQLQRSLIRSHAAGTGPEVEREVVRALMLLRLDTLASGRTGVRPVVVETYAAILNAGITPVVHEYGSLGCSGDLSPLAHCALTLMAEGDVRVSLDPHDAPISAAEALAAAGIEPLVLAEKEGLALINGTDGMLGTLCLALHDLALLLKTADIAAAASVEGLTGTDAVFAADLHALRPHPGQGAAAANMLRVLEASTLCQRPAEGEFTRVQDAYSLRCAPQVHGAARDTVDHAARVAAIELRSAIDNPVVLPDGRVESNGNFHGAPVAYVLDFLAIAVADVASISERRTDRFLDTARNHGLPPFLAADPGLDSGLMIAQYTSAGIVSELKRLAAPASVDSIPSSAMQEDHVSMGWHAGRKLRRAIDGLGRVIAIELLASTRALDFRALDAAAGVPGAATAAVHALFRTAIPTPDTDSFLSPTIAAAHEFVVTGRALEAVEGALGSRLD